MLLFRMFPALCRASGRPGHPVRHRTRHSRSETQTPILLILSILSKNLSSTFHSKLHNASTELLYFSYPVNPGYEESDL